MFRENKLAVLEGNEPNTAEGSLINADSKFKGTIKFKGSLRIEGHLDGKIISEGNLYVGKSGDIKASIEVGTLIVDGQIRGNIHAKNMVTLHPSAKVYGDISSDKLIIEEGATFVGNCECGKRN